MKSLSARLIQKVQLPAVNWKAGGCLTTITLIKNTSEWTNTAVAHAVKIKSSWLQQSLGEEFATTRAKEQNSARNNYFFSCSFWMLAVVRRCKGAGRPVGIKPCSDLKKKRSNTTSPSPLFHFKHSVKGLRLSLKLLRRFMLNFHCRAGQ